MRTYLLLSFIICSLFAKAQFVYKSPLPAVKKDGYYNLLLSPEARALCKRINLGDIRVKDEQGNDVPYFRQYENPTTEKYTEVNLGDFSIISKNKNSLIEFVNLPYDHKIDLLCIRASAKKQNYRRSGFIVSDTTYGCIWDTSFVISSIGDSLINLSNFHLTKRSRIVIHNYDNSPLDIEKIKAYQWNRYLCIYLEEGKKYTLYGGDYELDTPKYDLVYFEKNIPTKLPTIQMLPIQCLEVIPIIVPIVPEKKRPAMWFESPLFLWSIISVVAAFLFFLCYQMIKDLSKQKDR